MSIMDPLEEIRRLLPNCSAEARAQLFTELRRENPIHGLEADWNVTAEVVLEAIARATELTQRMFKGILAEAAFKVEVVDRLEGWSDVTPDGIFPYDFAIEDGRGKVTIQTKLQRSEKGVPLKAKGGRAWLKNPSQYVVETQKTRDGIDSEGKKTRPYRYGEFDIIAVSMKPVTTKWESFVYSVGNWLLPNEKNQNVMATLQPVSLEEDEDWTPNLITAIERFRSGTKKTIRNAP